MRMLWYGSARAHGAEQTLAGGHSKTVGTLLSPNDALLLPSNSNCGCDGLGTRSCSATAFPPVADRFCRCFAALPFLQAQPPPPPPIPPPDPPHPRRGNAGKAQVQRPPKNSFLTSSTVVG